MQANLGELIARHQTALEARAAEAEQAHFAALMAYEPRTDREMREKLVYVAGLIIGTHRVLAAQERALLRSQSARFGL